MDELAQQLQAVKTHRNIAKRQRLRRSRLDRYRAELEALTRQGASWRDLALWLRRFKRVHVHPTTVGRRLAYWQRG